MVVLKFGGTSVGSSEMIKRVKDIVEEVKDEKVVVVSAMNGVTDSLIKATNLAKEGSLEYLKEYETIKNRHVSVMNDLFNERLKEVDEILENLLNILKSINILGEVTKRAYDLILSFGERINVRIISEYFKRNGIKSIPVDANLFIITDDNFGNANPNYEKSKDLCEKIITPLVLDGITPVITGFIGRCEEGYITTLGRGGSDFTATIIANLIDADEVRIYTDVDGVLTGDPKFIKNAKTIKKLSYIEAAELAYYGAKVLHPRSLLPVIDKKIPVRILNTFNPNFDGTIIHDSIDDEKVIKAITFIKDISLISVNGKGMLGVPGISYRVFKNAYELKSNVLMISQSSSEQNICFVVKRDESEKLIDKLYQEFKIEIKNKEIDGIFLDNEVSIISIIGAKMKGRYGIAGKIFSILGENKINIIAIAQGSSEYNISFIVKDSDLINAVNILHDKLELGEN
jgi:aspartate kinase